MSVDRDGVIERLDLMLAVLQLAHHDAITRAAEELRGDTVNAAILDAWTDWTPSTEVYTAVRTATGASERTVRGRLAALQTRRALWARGTAAARQFRATGLI